MFILWLLTNGLAEAAKLASPEPRTPQVAGAENDVGVFDLAAVPMFLPDHEERQLGFALEAPSSFDPWQHLCLLFSGYRALMIFVIFVDQIARVENEKNPDQKKRNDATNNKTACEYSQHSQHVILRWFSRSSVVSANLSRHRVGKIPLRYVFVVTAETRLEALSDEGAAFTLVLDSLTHCLDGPKRVRFAVDRCVCD